MNPVNRNTGFLCYYQGQSGDISVKSFPEFIEFGIKFIFIF